MLRRFSKSYFLNGIIRARFNCLWDSYRHYKGIKTISLTTLYEACAVEAVSIIVCHSLKAAASGVVSDGDWSPLAQPVTRASVITSQRLPRSRSQSDNTACVMWAANIWWLIGTGIQKRVWFVTQRIEQLWKCEHLWNYYHDCLFMHSGGNIWLKSHRAINWITGICD